ncbi:TraR/DksA C4-type zinc finger protein [Candidatus Woesebacteria bacterium]|nr:TraR/DksA C4-type zinc finger protein [Candidatus Woesebacteria bacterium]
MTKTQDVISKLQKEKISAEASIETLKASDPFADPDYATDNASVDTDVREQESHQRIMAEIDSLEHRISDINESIERAEKGVYGVCKRCNKEIPPKRLELLPESIYCVTCESELTK